MSARAEGITPNRLVDRLRFQLGFGFVVTVIVPALVRHGLNLEAIQQSSSINTLFGTGAALMVGVYLFRRVAFFPGVNALAYVMPSFAASYGLVLAVFFLFRLDYSRFYYGVSFFASLLLFFLVCVYSQGRKGRRFYVVPAGETHLVVQIPNVDWVFLKEPKLPDDPVPVLVADLRADLGDDWERMIAEVATAGHPVYHVKQMRESLTGRVEIEHLSENSFGSLVPNLSYRKVKRLIDLLLSIVLLPLIAAPALGIAIAIKLDSPGPVFFKQKRMGFRGRPFSMIKFRTMRERSGVLNGAEQRDDAITRDADGRVTRVGRFLRRTRMDELPQILNVLRGQMSWIGPRPEAIPLSEWYQRELPFYAYRHIVRPGITGWAQVNQGHVAELSAVHEKLHYDFYYIKNFSGWLDWLILFRTFWIVVTGHGSK